MEKDYRSRQIEIKGELEKRYAAQDYTFEKPFIQLNPFEISPLTALIMFETEKECRISILVQGKDKYTTFSNDFAEMKKRHKIPVYGLYAGKKNEITLTMTDAEGIKKENMVCIETEALPYDFSHIKVERCIKEFVEPGLTFIMGNKGLPVYYRSKGMLKGPAYAQGFDMNGDVRWYLTDKSIGSIAAFVPLKNGNVCIGSEKNEEGAYYKKSAYEMSLMGEIYHEYAVSGMHHDFEEMPNGNIVALCRKPGTREEEDYMVEFDRETGAIVDGWDFKNIYKVNNQAAPNYLDSNGNPDCVDWLHANAVVYDVIDDTFVVSARNQDAVFKFKRATGEIRWIATEPEDRFSDEIKSKLLKPVGKDFYWHHGQHHVQKAGAEQWILFDNQSFFTKKDVDYLDKSNKTSRAVLFRVDEEQMTIEQLWKSDFQIGNQNASSIMGAVEYYGKGHVMVNYASVNRHENGTYNYEYLGFVDAPYQNSTIVEYYYDQVVFYATYDGNYGNIYRANKSMPYWSETELR